MENIIKHSSINWNDSKSLDLKKVKWIPIFTIDFSKDYKRTFGLTSDGKWMNEIIQGKNRKISVARNKGEYLSIITVLEKDRAEIEKLVFDGLKKNTAGNYEIDIFPFLDLIKFAIERDGGYWAKHAIFWLKQDEFDRELCEIANNFISEKKLDQKSRHHLFRFMKRFERDKAQTINEEKADNTK